MSVTVCFEVPGSVDPKSSQQVRIRHPSRRHGYPLPLTPFYSDVTALLPPLFSLLDPASATFQPTVSAVLAVLSAPAFVDGSGSATLTLPLLQWCAQAGPPVIKRAIADGPDDVASAFCRLLAGLGDHSTTYLAFNPKTPLVQSFLHREKEMKSGPRQGGIY